MARANARGRAARRGIAGREDRLAAVPGELPVAPHRHQYFVARSWYGALGERAPRDEIDLEARLVPEHRVGPDDLRRLLSGERHHIPVARHMMGHHVLRWSFGKGLQLCFGEQRHGGTPSGSRWPFLVS